MTKLTVAAKINKAAAQHGKSQPPGPPSAFTDGVIRSAFLGRGYDVDIWRAGPACEVHVYRAGTPQGGSYVMGFNPKEFAPERVAELLGDAPTSYDTLRLQHAARRLLAQLAELESDGELVLPPDTRCGDCTAGTRHFELCARHQLQRLLREHPNA